LIAEILLAIGTIVFSGLELFKSENQNIMIMAIIMNVITSIVSTVFGIKTVGKNSMKQYLSYQIVVTINIITEMGVTMFFTINIVNMLLKILLLISILYLVQIHLSEALVIKHKKVKKKNNYLPAENIESYKK
jgi:uncharacterized membrane protein YcaP (DUF421 family)